MQMTILRVITLVMQLVPYSAAAAADGAPPVQLVVDYVVTISQPHTHVFAVRMEITGSDQRYIDVSMPVWTPGSYLVREYERHVISFTASGSDGNELKWRKIDKNTWRVTRDNTTRVVIEYEVYGREPGIRWSFVNDLGGHIIGPNLFMHVVGATSIPTTARFELPEDWRLDGGIAPSQGDPFLISARSYHQLIDTPMLIGEFTDTTFQVEGVPHLIAILGQHNADLQQLSEDFEKIVRTCSKFFGGLPYERYALVYTTLAGGGGIEHANGTTIGLGDIDFRDEQAKAGIRGVTSHEYFHAWNVKRIQPPAFRPYNYEEENYTDALWFYEGFTSYYGDRILHRAGLLQQLENPTNMVVNYRSTPGHHNQSAADASFNAWIHLYRGDESTDNYRTDYYFVGSVIATLLELEIAHRSKGSRGVDDVMRLMWQRTRDHGAAFDSDAILAVSEEVSGGSLREFWHRYVFGTDDVPFEDFFRLAGYELNVDDAATTAQDQRGYLGIYTRETNGRVFVNGVALGSAAWRDGLNYDDEILAVNGRQANGLDSFLQILREHHPGQKIEISVSRFGQPKTITVTLGRRPVPVYELAEVEQPSELQLAVRRRWLQLER